MILKFLAKYYRGRVKYCGKNFKEIEVWEKVIIFFKSKKPMNKLEGSVINCLVKAKTSGKSVIRHLFIKIFITCHFSLFFLIYFEITLFDVSFRVFNN